MGDAFGTDTSQYLISRQFVIDDGAQKTVTFAKKLYSIRTTEPLFRTLIRTFGP